MSHYDDQDTDSLTTNILSEPSSSHSQSQNLLKETKLLRDTLDLMLNKSIEQKKICEQLANENKLLQDYVENLMSSGNVLSQ